MNYNIIAACMLAACMPTLHGASSSVSSASSKPSVLSSLSSFVSKRIWSPSVTTGLLEKQYQTIQHIWPTLPPPLRKLVLDYMPEEALVSVPCRLTELPILLCSDYQGSEEPELYRNAYACSYSPDLSHVATVERTGDTRYTLFVRNVKTQEIIFDTSHEHVQSYPGKNSLQWSCNGRLLAHSTYGYVIFDPFSSNKSPVYDSSITHHHFNRKYFCTDQSPVNDDILVFIDDNRNIVIYNIRTKSSDPIIPIKFSKNKIASTLRLWWSPQGSSIAVRMDDTHHDNFFGLPSLEYEIVLYNVASGKPQCTITRTTPYYRIGGVDTTLTFSNDERLLAIAHSDTNCIDLYEASTGKLQRSINLPGQAKSIVWLGNKLFCVLLEKKESKKLPTDKALIINSENGSIVTTLLTDSNPSAEHSLSFLSSYNQLLISSRILHFPSNTPTSGVRRWVKRKAPYYKASNPQLWQPDIAALCNVGITPTPTSTPSSYAKATADTSSSSQATDPFLSFYTFDELRGHFTPEYIKAIYTREKLEQHYTRVYVAQSSASHRQDEGKEEIAPARK